MTQRNYSEASETDNNIMKSARQYVNPIIERKIAEIVDIQYQEGRISKKDYLKQYRAIAGTAFGSKYFIQKHVTRESKLTVKNISILAKARFPISSAQKALLNKDMERHGIQPKKSKRRILGVS